MESETFDRAKEVLLKQLKRLLRGIRPRKCDVRIRYGTGDPKSTAEVLAAYGALYPLLGAYLHPEADFSRRVIGGTARVKGRVTVARILLCAGIIYFNKDIRRVRARFEKVMRGT